MTTNTHMHLRVLRSGGRSCKRPQFNMKLNNSRKILFNIWPQVLCTLWICCKYVAGRNLSQHDISLLEEEDDPKCFTRTEEDFTCFFQTTDNGTFDLFYKIGQSEEKRCELLTQRTKEGMLLHICSFPYLDVVSYVDIHLQVVERNNNNNNTNTTTTTTTRLYSRMVSVEDHILLDAPFNVALLHNGKPGQLQLSCLTNVPKYWEDKLRYRIRYTSKRLGQRTKEVLGMDDSVMSLVPGEEVRVEIAVKCGNIESAGHWSRWSQPVRDVVPQSADDISLKCHTSDLQMISCQWNGSTYSQANGSKLFTKMHLSETLGWTDWTQCVPDKKLTEQCTFQGEEWKKVRVKVSTAAFPLSRTFYTQEFTLRNIIQTEPPAHLTGLLEKDKLCLKWEAPLMTTLSSHLQYEVGCQIRESKAWVVISPKGPATGTCLEVPPRIQYRVKVRAKPNGSIYSGQWSQWSHVVSGKTPADIETLLLTCIPATLLVTAVLLISLGFTYARKLKQWFWPPVPNLDKVLQGFVKEINLQKWDPPVTAKQYFEEGTDSIVEVMSQDGLSGSGQESTQLLSPSQGRRAGDREEGNPRTELKLFPDYVTLNRECVTICSSTNKYVCEQQPGEIRGPGVEGELLPKTSHSFCVPHNNFLNHSYLPLSDPALEVQDKDTGLRPPENVYTNLPCS